MFVVAFISPTTFKVFCGVTVPIPTTLLLLSTNKAFVPIVKLALIAKLPVIVSPETSTYLTSPCVWFIQPKSFVISLPRISTIFFFTPSSVIQ
ncbi:hypothetical protein ES703_69976 [subsurface metagenome]